MRPRVALPTGTWMGAPVLVTGTPRARPSVVSMAMQRTVFSPRCCATSMTRLSLSLEMVELVNLSAVYTSGRPPGGNSTSTTGPRTWVTRPVVGTFALIVVVAPGSALGELWGRRALSTDPLVPGQGPSADTAPGVVRRISGACRAPGPSIPPVRERPPSDHRRLRRPGGRLLVRRPPPPPGPDRPPRRGALPAREAGPPLRAQRGALRPPPAVRGAAPAPGPGGPRADGPGAGPGRAAVHPGAAAGARGGGRGGRLPPGAG